MIKSRGLWLPGCTGELIQVRPRVRPALGPRDVRAALDFRGGANPDYVGLGTGASLTPSAGALLAWIFPDAIGQDSYYCRANAGLTQLFSFQAFSTTGQIQLSITRATAAL